MRALRALAVCAASAAALSLLVAPDAAVGAEIQRPDEVAYLTLYRHGFEIGFALYPEREVAALYTETGVRRSEARGGRFRGVAYAAPISSRPVSDGIDLSLGDVARLAGRFVPDQPARRGRNNRGCHGPAPVSESGHFEGRVVVRGDGGYLLARARRASLEVSRSFRLRCRRGHARHIGYDSLFGYVEPPTRSFMGSDGTMLDASITGRRRVTEFAAVRHLHEATTTFKAGTLEWLPGDVATSRWVEVSRVANSLFTTGPPALHPASASVEPPAPFSGNGRYRRRTHSLTGHLAVAFPGLHLRLAGRRARARICVFTRKLLERVCK